MIQLLHSWAASERAGNSSSSKLSQNTPRLRLVSEILLGSTGIWLTDSRKTKQDHCNRGGFLLQLCSAGGWWQKSFPPSKLVLWVWGRPVLGLLKLQIDWVGGQRFFQRFGFEAFCQDSVQPQLHEPGDRRTRRLW